MKRILIVEDEYENIENLVDSLESFNISIRFALNGAEALELLQREQFAFNLIISDISMPQMNGLEFHEEVQKINKKIPFIFLSAHGSASDLPLSDKLDLIEKPYDEQLLQNKVREYLGL